MQLNRSLPHIATICASLLFVVITVDAFSSFNGIEPVTVQENQRLEKPVAVNLEKPKNISPTSLAKLHLFGKASPTAKTVRTKTAAPETVPISTIKLTIKGLFSNEDSAQGMAVIAKQGVDKPYNVGDTIDNNIKLHAVYSDHVIIANHDRLEKLQLPEFRAISNNPNSLRNLAKQKRLAMKKQGPEADQTLQ